MKTISILLPTYNEEENILPLYDALREQLTVLGERYDYEILFIDNKSQDNTREKILQLCACDKRVKAIFNARNFGGACNSPYHGLLQTSGDCTIFMCADFQDPPELLPRMVEAWEQGNKIVCMVKTNSRARGLSHMLRTVYYGVIHRLSDVEIIENYNGFGLYDKSIVDMLRSFDDPEPFFGGLIAELGFARLTIPYTQEKRRAGKSSNDFFALYDYAMRSVTAYTKAGLRLATFLGVLVSAASLIAAFIYPALKLASQGQHHMDIAPLLAIGMFFLGGVQLFFLGLLGEYLISIRRRMMKRPLVIEESRVNF